MQVANLELLRNVRTGDTKTSLFGVLNHCKTGAGSRMLRAALIQPSAPPHPTSPHRGLPRPVPPRAPHRPAPRRALPHRTTSRRSTLPLPHLSQHLHLRLATAERMAALAAWAARETPRAWVMCGMAGTDMDTITARHDCVVELIAREDALVDVQKILPALADCDRMLKLFSQRRTLNHAWSPAATTATTAPYAQ